MPETGYVRTIRPEEEQKQYSGEFIDQMIFRTQVHGLMKYGPIQDWMKENPEYNHLECLQQRLLKYMITGDKRWLVDVANYAMFEYEHPQHPARVSPSNKCGSDRVVVGPGPGH